MKGTTSQAPGLRTLLLGSISPVTLALLVSPLLPPAAAAQRSSAQPAATQSAAAAQPAAPQPAAPQALEAPPNMNTYYVALLRRGPNWTTTLTPEISKAIDGHMANIRRLAAEGKLLLAGPFLDQSGPGTLAGLFVLEAASIEEAKQLVATDPAVQIGRFVPEVLPWLGPKSLRTLSSAPGNR